MKLACVALVLMGCLVDEDERFPIEPGGGTAGESIPMPGDAMIRGNVCMAEDLIIRTPCLANGVGGLEVALGGFTTTTFADGSFILPRPTGSLLQFQVSGPGAITTTTPFSPSFTIPVINADVWATMLASNEIFLPEGTGSILGSVIRDGVPASGVSVVSTPAGVAGPFFDTETGFGLDRTGARGVFLVPGINSTAASIAFSPGESNVSGISVINGGVTILDSVTLP